MFTHAGRWKVFTVYTTREVLTGLMSETVRPSRRSNDPRRELFRVSSGEEIKHREAMRIAGRLIERKIRRFLNAN
jgi:hypothetical protein